MLTVVTTLLFAVTAGVAGPAQPIVAVDSAAGPAAALVTWQQEADPGEPLDLNAATAEELQEVPGIGPTLAGRIVAFREEHGPFEKVDDLLNVQGIGTRSLERIRPYVTVGTPDGEDPVVAGDSREAWRR